MSGNSDNKSELHLQRNKEQVWGMHGVMHFLSFHLLSKNLKIKISRTINIFVVFHGCESRFEVAVQSEDV
jgi:UDP-N-acetylmuramate-alanine ligase